MHLLSCGKVTDETRTAGGLGGRSEGRPGGPRYVCVRSTLGAARCCERFHFHKARNAGLPACLWRNGRGLRDGCTSSLVAKSRSKVELRAGSAADPKAGQEAR